MNTKNIYYEHDEASGTSIGVKYEKYLYRCQSKFQNIEVIKTYNYGNALFLDGCFMLSEINQDYYHNTCLDLTPKKLGLLSLPFLVLPTPFLCAIIYSLLLNFF